MLECNTFFECQECGKCFSMKSNLIGHKAIHTDERPFHCESCDKTYKHKQDLRKHERVVHA